jgi:hypothetical protein
MNKYLAAALSSLIVVGAYALPAGASDDACLDSCSMQLMSCDRQMQKKLMPGQRPDNRMVFAQCKAVERNCINRCEMHQR